MRPTANTGATKFLSTLSLRRATCVIELIERRLVFLSTLSLRRATSPIDVPQYQILISIHALLAESDNFRCSVKCAICNFYPRSPCGERPHNTRNNCIDYYISIHALLAESDGCGQYCIHARGISIHALLAESDPPIMIRQPTPSRFLSTLSLRRATESQPPCARPTRDFYPRSPCGERRHEKIQNACACLFLSTLSLRRATRRGASESIGTLHFYPRSPCGERRAKLNIRQIQKIISIHALLAESDWDWFFTGTLNPKFLSTLSLRRATHLKSLWLRR